MRSLRSVLVVAAMLLAGCRAQRGADAGAPRVDVRRPTPMSRALVAEIDAAEARARAALPPGPGSELARSRCVACHSIALITQQRKDEASWTRTLGTMKSWGTAISADDERTLLAYLLAHFGPAGSPTRER